MKKRENALVFAVLFVSVAAIFGYVGYDIYAARNITLTYESVPEETTECKEITKDEVGGMMSQDEIGSVTVFSYYGKDTKTLRMGGFAYDDKVYSVGQVALNAYGTSNFSASTATVNDKTLYKMLGSYGSGEPYVKYYDLSNGAPKLLLTAYGTVSEKDFDGDGNTEIIALAANGATIKIYRIADQAVTMADISKRMHAVSATYSATDNVFTVVRDSNNPNKKSAFEYSDGKLRMQK